MPRITIPSLLETVRATPNTHTILRYHIEAEVREFPEAYVVQLNNSAKPNQYDSYSKEWREICHASNEFSVVRVQVDGRLNAGLGNASIHEVGFSFHHTFGTPYLPGSTIKGWLAAFARTHTAISPDVCDTLFGTLNESGVVVFHDALPSKRNDIKLATDIVNPHQKYYYRGTYDDPPSDMDTPVVVQFVTVASGTRFDIPIQSAYADYRALAVKILQSALQHSAIGAKTNAGYGRMKFIEV